MFEGSVNKRRTSLTSEKGEIFHGSETINSELDPGLPTICSTFTLKP